MTIWCHALPSSPSCHPSSSSCPTPIGHLFPSRLPVKPAMTIAPGNDDMVPCTSFFSIMPFMFPSCPTVSLSCPTPIGHLTFPLVMPDPDRAPNTFMPNYRKNRRQITENNRIFCHFHDSCYICQ